MADLRESMGILLSLDLTLLAQAQVPLNYWWEAFSNSLYLINNLPSPVTQNKSPYSLIYHKEPEYNSLKPFVCA